MKQVCGRLALLVAVFSAAPTSAEGEARHVAASAGLTAGLYLLMSGIMGREQAIKGPSLGAAVGMALAAGLAVEAVQSIQRGDRRIDGRDMAANTIGIGGASCAILLLDF